MKESGFIHHLHAFRGFAIVNIVAAHAFGSQVFMVGGASNSVGVSWMHAISETLFHDSTLYFTLISGLLFSLVLRERGWQRFFLRKFSNVFAPYVIITTILTLFIYVRRGHGAADSDFFYLVSGNILTGGAMYHLWYIPVLLLLYLLTPLVAFFAERKRVQWLLWMLVLLPLIVSRQWSWPGFSWETLVYFSGAYAAGIALGYRYEEALTYARRAKSLVFVCAVVTSLILIVLYLKGYGDGSPVSVRETLFYIQKLSLSILAIGWFKEFGESIPVWLERLAVYSFPIYFLHVVVMSGLAYVSKSLSLHAHSYIDVLSYGTSYLVLSIVLSIFIAYVVRVLSGKWSRQLIGL